MKHINENSIDLILTIQEAHPLKQGLKLNKNISQDEKDKNSRGTSTKTRIETRMWSMNIPTWNRIQEAHPLKQGLVNSIVYQSNNFFCFRATVTDITLPPELQNLLSGLTL